MIFKKNIVPLYMCVFYYFVVLVFIFVTPSVCEAQKVVLATSKVSTKTSLTWKAHILRAEKAAEQRKPLEAAVHYEQGWLMKPKKMLYAYNAATAYAAGRNYEKAAELYKSVIDSKAHFAALRLDYALSLQQKGDFSEAIAEFSYYLNHYNSADKAIISERIEQYIAGCTWAIQQADIANESKVRIEHLPINTPDNDLAPVTFGEDVLYFTTLTAGKIAKIFRTQQTSEGKWAAAESLKNLPISAETAYGNGTFAPDGSRFYCTMCAQVTDKKRTKQLSCGIYFLKRTTDGWTSPQRLSDNVNAPNGMTTQPYVCHKANKEMLFFVSNRAGGEGGMDIWLSSRSRLDDKSAFEPPLNLGGIINTTADEVTPFYDTDEGAIYFSSNGRAAMGGLDIYKSSGFQQHWTTPVNLGLPFNSGADDWYFTKNTPKTGGFFVSNRPFGTEKTGTEDDDIFQFIRNDRRDLSIFGRIFDKKTQLPLDNIRVSLSEKIPPSGDAPPLDKRFDMRLLSSVMCSIGAYRFALLPQKDYVLSLEKDGYDISEMPFTTRDSGQIAAKSVLEDVYLVKTTAVAAAKTPVISASTDAPTSLETLEDIEKSRQRLSSKVENTEGVPVLKGRAEKSDNMVFKVQVLAYSSDDAAANVKKLTRVTDLGTFDTEFTLINGQRFTRILISFPTFAEATAALKIIKERSLTDAFIVKYENGKRIMPDKAQ